MVMGSARHDVVCLATVRGWGPFLGCDERCLKSLSPRGRVELKYAEEIMEILNAYDLTGSLRDAGELAGCSHHTVKHYVERRAAGGELDQAAARAQLIDEYLPKVEEWVERSKGKVRADVARRLDEERRVRGATTADGPDAEDDA